MSTELKVTCSYYGLCMGIFTIQSDIVICPGEVVLYIWIEWLKEQQHLWAPASEPEHDPQHPPDSDAELANAIQQVCFCSRFQQPYQAAVLHNMRQPQNPQRQYLMSVGCCPSAWHSSLNYGK